MVVAVVAIVLVGLFALARMPRDIFPDLGVPTVYVAQTYGGMDPAQMEGFIVNYYEYHFLYITGIEHVESKSIQGIGLIKLQFHPGTNMAQAVAETVSYVDRARAFMPAGTLPPFVLRFDAGSVPVGSLVFSSKTRSVAELQDAALFRVRPLFATLPGVSAPPPFGSSQRTIVIHADPDKLRAYNMSPDEVVRAVAAGNNISPSGNVRIGDVMPMVPINSVVSDVKELNNVPIRTQGTRTVFLRDIGSVEDAADIQTGYALVDGRRTVYIPVTKRADASTLAVVGLVKENLPRFQSVLPDDIEVSYQFDQSPYVTRAITGLIFEGGLGAALTGLMMLLFLRDWRSALVVVLNIPLAILAATIALWATGQTVNIITLGGLALAVGILVDESTVAIENIHTHLRRGRSLARAACDATAETTVPRFLAMLCIVAVFIPAFFMNGAARNLFVPLSMAVGFAMAGSYFLSSTLVPVLSVWILDAARRDEAGRETTSTRLRRRYEWLVSFLIAHRRVVLLSYLAICGMIVAVVGGRLGTEIFPAVDAGQFQLRLRAQPGTRIERTEQIALRTLDAIKREVGPENVEISLGFVGTPPPNYPINAIYLWSSGSEEALLQIQLKRKAGIHVEALKETLRKKLACELPGVRFSFEPSDIVSRVMSFGAPTPIEVAVSGPNITEVRRYAERLQGKLAQLPMLRDLAFEQELDYPVVNVDVNRERAGVMGVTADDIGRSVVAGTSSSRYTAANYWADPKSGVGYQVQVDIPEKRMNSLEEVRNLPIARRSGQQIDLRNLATISEATTLGEYDRYNMQRMLTLSANIAGADLGRAAQHVQEAVQFAGKPPEKVKVAVRGQVEPMSEMFNGLRSGLLVAVVVILLLLTANFQSLRLSLAVVLTIPAVISGVAGMLWLTHTTLNIQSFMGAIMAVGVAVANSILLVTFAERSRVEGRELSAAALDGASSRLRPILMTSLAMIAGMVPMAVGLGEGGEQTAPLGRAVIGGLAGATCATLLVVPAIFTLLAWRRRVRSASLDPDDPQSVTFDGASAQM
jgi:multidrug efflux pump subunit AcrB